MYILQINHSVYLKLRHLKGFPRCMRFLSKNNFKPCLLYGVRSQNFKKGCEVTLRKDVSGKGRRGMETLGFFSCRVLGPHPEHMEIPRLGGKSELQLPGYATATATQDPSHVCDLYHSSWQRQIHNPLSRVRDQTGVPMDTNQVHYL